MDQINVSGFRVVGPEQSASVAGNAYTRLDNGLGRRSGVIISNIDTTFDLRVRLVSRGASAPTYADRVRLVNVLAGSSLALAAGESVDIYVANSSNATNTSTVVYQDYGY